MRTRRCPGDYIPSSWEDDYGREEYVYGHVSSATAASTLLRETGMAYRSSELPVQYGYLRIGFASAELRANGCEMELHLSGQRGRGAMPVTIVEYSDLYPGPDKA